MSSDYVLSDVFTDRRFGGNQLAVFPDAADIPIGLMPRIARELNLSETVFVLPPDDPAHTCRLRILTPAMELPFAGHPTVGTACVLAALGRVQISARNGDLIFEEGVGAVRVRVSRQEPRWSANFEVPRLPVSGPEAPPIQDIAAMLGIPVDNIRAGAEPVPVSCGVPFLFVTVRDRSMLSNVRLDHSVWERVLSDFWAPHVYVLCIEPPSDVTTVHARMFAPAMGIIEDPATGAAASALPGYLEAARTDGIRRWRVEQGHDMGRPSRIEVESLTEGGVIRSIRVGGHCVLVGRGSLDLEA